MALVTTYYAWGQERGYFIEVSRSQVDQVWLIFSSWKYTIFLCFLKNIIHYYAQKEKKNNKNWIGYLHYGAT